jgi:hypothetical protein
MNDYDWTMLNIDFDRDGLQLVSFDAYLFLPWWLLGAVALVAIVTKVRKTWQQADVRKKDLADALDWSKPAAPLR